MVVLYILYILLPSPTSCDLVAGLKNYEQKTEPGTGSVRFRYPNKLVLSHYMFSKPLRHPLAGRPAIVGNRNAFPWGLNDDEDNYKQTFHHTNLPAGSPSFIPYAGARSLTNITKFIHHVHHNLHSLHGRNRYGNREDDEQMKLLAKNLRLNLHE
ncbi:unnamed protein product [Orchesella dallaii]|uniref:Uncharacterized protein n=1 Tax=Orchesella dallaii TaxID=48710 RepID=A0ABP1S0D4_9HEXA